MVSMPRGGEGDSRISRIDTTSEPEKEISTARRLVKKASFTEAASRHSLHHSPRGTTASSFSTLDATNYELMHLRISTNAVYAIYGTGIIGMIIPIQPHPTTHLNTAIDATLTTNPSLCHHFSPILPFLILQ
ncbi:hypothetical protein TcWFU_006044 [Taenia crassiceps]|uniref:Uncharacterized protein n=1 Tax=Taenia crassiceps TaxID=6207 RepID=A0ABR4QBP8_9CEST